MKLFGLEGIGVIISLAMTLLVSGAIMFYCLRRFKILENSLVEQGRVLQSFIIKYQIELNDSMNMASPIAQASAIQQASINNKIEVSDDESYLTESGDSESESDNED